MKVKSFLTNGTKICIFIPLFGYFLIIIMVANYVIHTGTFSPNDNGGLSEFSFFSPIVMFFSTTLNLISVSIGAVLNTILILVTKKIKIKYIIFQIAEISLLIWIIFGKINNIPVLWILFD